MINVDEDVNWEPVLAALERENLPEAMGRDVRDLTYRTAQSWLNKDLDMFEIVGVEETHKVDIGGQILKAVVDLECIVHSKNANKIPVGSRVRLDWKTSGLLLETPYGRQKFSSLYKESFQGRIYPCIPPKSDYFLFRGISKVDSGSYQLIQTPYEGQEKDVTAFLRQGRAAIESQKGASLPWLKNTKACEAFGTVCPHTATCLRGTPDEFLVDPPPLEHLSFSSLEAFILCNERYRRDRIELGGLIEDDSSDASRYGKAFHVAIAEVYKQFKKN